MDLLTVATTFVAGLGLGCLLGLLWARSRPAGGLTRVVEDAVDRAEVLQGLDRLSDQVQHLDQQRARWQGHFDQQVADMRHANDTLRRETQSLSTALRKPQVRGAWGELHLRRVVELAGLVDRCDFAEQVPMADGALRPDLVVHLAGGRQVVVDAKVPLDAFLDAQGAAEDEREDHLARHARQLRTHVDTLGSKGYWRALPETPELVVMFVPAEAFLAAALDTQSDLLEHAAARQVVLATPTTLIALLRTIAHGWSHARLAEQTVEVQRLGRELHGRLATLSAHVDKVGRSLGAAVAAYNQAAGSLEGRVLVSARRFQDLGVTSDGLAGPRQVEETPRTLAPPEDDADHDADVQADLRADLEALGELRRPARRARGA